MEEIKALGEIFKALEKNLPKLRPESVTWLVSRLKEFALPLDDVSRDSPGPKSASSIARGDDE